MKARLDQIDQHIASINDKPAMRLTPLTLAAESHQAAMAYGAEDRKSVGEARDALSESLGRVEGMIKQRRSNDRSEERRVGKECVSKCRSRGSPCRQKKKKRKK